MGLHHVAFPGDPLEERFGIALRRRVNRRNVHGTAGDLGQRLLGYAVERPPASSRTTDRSYYPLVEPEDRPHAKHAAGVGFDRLHSPRLPKELERLDERDEARSLRHFGGTRNRHLPGGSRPDGTSRLEGGETLRE